MPCLHYDIRIVKWSDNESAACQSGDRLFSEYDQEQKYYPYKSEVVHKEILLPPHVPPEYSDRNTLWNAAETVEKQWNSQLARRIVLPQPDIQACEQGCNDPSDEYGVRCAHAVHRSESGSAFSAGGSGGRLCAVRRGALPVAADGPGGKRKDKEGKRTVDVDPVREGGSGRCSLSITGWGSILLINRT